METKKTIFIVISLVIFAILIFHISKYIFQCDDAFISFRYAKNIADGHGPVFNVGEKVEGYTNFLWVLILSIFSLFGVAPDSVANILTIVISVSLFLAIFYFNKKLFAESKHDFYILIAPLLIALSRTYTVWSTGGLETKLFSFLIFLAVMALVKGQDGNAKYIHLSAVLFAVASLTRPEGILLFGSFWAYFLIHKFKNRQALKQILQSTLTFVILVGAHFIFRVLYYGYPFPNTFYAKVTGAWFEQGLLYLFTFVHEYGLYFTLPAIIFVCSNYYDPDRRRILLYTAIPFLPYIVYLAYIGGDHFEFRPLDIFVPFLAIWIQEGIRALSKRLSTISGKLQKILIPIYGLVFLFFYTVPGYLSHINFTKEYDSAVAVNTSGADNAISSIPGIRQYLILFDKVHSKLASHFVCIRQEEHKLAFEQVFKPQAMLMKDAVDKNIIRREEIISLWCVGAIPYYTGLTTIDYIGLTDAHVAHRPLPDIPEKLLPFDKLMAHQKRADWNYLKERDVTYISTVPAKFFFPISEYFAGDQLIEDRLPRGVYLVPVGDYAFVFKSIYIPRYFKYHMNRKGIDFYYRTVDRGIQFYPGSKP